ncbi:hypothetical protein D3C76_1177960 [compost metagenome]
MVGQRTGVGEFQANVRRRHAAQRPFAHGLAGVVEVLGHQRIGLGPGGQPGQRALQLFRAAVTHELHHALTDASLDLGDVGGAFAEGFFRLLVQGRAGLVRTFVFAAKLQRAGVRRRHRIAAFALVAGFDFFNRREVSLRRAQWRRSLRCTGEHRQA